jgi:hypothetical protein
MPQLVTFSTPAAAGTFTVEFQGASGTLSHSANATLTVTPPQSPYLVSATYYPWYDASSFEFNVDCYNDTLRGELLPPELPIPSVVTSKPANGGQRRHAHSRAQLVVQESDQDLT